MSLATSMRRGTRTLVEFLWPERAEDRSIPVLDGGLSPNDELDTFQELWRGPADVDDVAVLGARLVVSHGRTVSLLDASTGQVRAALDLEHMVGALAASDEKVLFVVTVGGPIHRVAVGEAHLRIEADIAGDLHCPTAAALDGTSLLVTVGSAEHGPGEWSRDLMTKGRSGEVVEVDLASGERRTVVQNLAWAGGLVVLPDGDVLVSESWRHRIVRVDRHGGTVTPVTQALAGYPGRLCPTTGGEIAVAFVSLRTHLVEFVLREDEFRAEMVRTVDPKFWICPAHELSDERWEPLQIGSIKHLNVTKPWAPPRAYGLAAVMGTDGVFRDSWHARVGSPRSGITGIATLGDRPVVVSRGARNVLIDRKADPR